MAVGEYEKDYDFFLPKPVSIRREYLRLRFQIEWCMQKLQKNEDTWYRMLRHYDAECDTTLRVFKRWWHRWHCYT